MAGDFDENALYEGDFILAQTPVIFFMKKKKKQQTPQRLVLLITKDTAALAQADQTQKAVVKFPRNTVVDVSFNQNESGEYQYKMQLTVFIGNKARVLCIEFPGADAHQQRELFVQHFEGDKQKETPGYPQQTTLTTATPSSVHGATATGSAAASAADATTTTTHGPAAIAASTSDATSTTTTTTHRRGTKRKPTATLDDALIYKRARHLLKHKYLASLYHALVLEEKILSSQEFFEQYGTEYGEQQQQIGSQSGLSNHCLRGIIQRKTWSLFELFQQDFQKQQQQTEDGGETGESNNKHSIKVTLTREKILEIFVNLPEVRLAYEHRVPHAQSEQEFWKDFLQSHYFRRHTAKSVTSSVAADKETTLDALLRKYATQLAQEQQEHATHEGSSSSGGNAATSKMTIAAQNSFATQLADVQLAKNREVDVDSRVQGVNDEIARARALKNGEENVDESHSHQGAMAVDGAAAVEADENKPLKRRALKKKLAALDPSVDLTATMETIHEVDDDPGVEEQRVHRDDVQSWFQQMNKHQRMLLEQHAAAPAACSDYEQRLDAETDLEDLREERAQNYVPLNIADKTMSVYWGEHVWLGERELKTAAERAARLGEYLTKCSESTQTKPLRDCQVTHVVHKHMVANSLKVNTQNNAAASRASLASEQIESAKRTHDNGSNASSGNGAKATYYIYTQQRAVKTSAKLLEQLSVFQKQTKQLARHYWSCFPANPQRMRKAQVIQQQIQNYRTQLQQFQQRLKQKARHGKGSEQTVLTQELIEFVDQIVTHFEKTQQEYQQKKLHIQELQEN